MKELLKKYTNSNEYVCVYASPKNSSGFSFGKILAVDEDFFAFLELDVDGAFDGVEIRLIDEVGRIETKSAYVEKMKKLIDGNGLDVINTLTFGGEVLADALKYSQKNKRVVSIEINTSGNYDVVGIVESIDGDMCKVSSIDNYGLSDGYAEFCIGDITKMTLMSKNDRITEKLFEKSKKA
ncbi:MAG: hypothetical protein Q4C21_09245 [Oscillospiraceae bacterium]|nr:hypothetical protein [Oscillospiraceae bacterium]